jgi:endonuclease YncB( thermonuclease family)
VVGVHDGDSITVLTANKHRIKVRLDGIDAPELGQAFGRRAKEALSKMVFGKYVDIELRSKDRFGRTVARVYLNGRCINLEIVQAGMAWHFLKYSKDKNLQRAENEARANKIGLWGQGLPIAPWYWRKTKTIK